MPVADEDLRVTLESVLGRQVRTMARRPNAYCSSFHIEDIEVMAEDGPPLRLIFKDLAAAALSPQAREAKPAALLDARREIEAYLDVLLPAGVEVPRCYGAVAEPSIGRYWLFLEAVDGDPLWQVDEPSAWEEAVRWLADLHAGEAPAVHSHLIRYDAAYLRHWIDRAVSFAPEGSLEAIAAGWSRVVGELSAWAPTFVHGEFYPSNVLVRRGTARPRIVPVDWEMAGVGPGLLDLAALASGGWTQAERERLALVYLDALPPSVRPPADVLLRSLTYFRLYVAVQWVGWSQDWTPPVGHAHDWLGEALSLADELGL